MKKINKLLLLPLVAFLLASCGTNKDSGTTEPASSSESSSEAQKEYEAALDMYPMLPRKSEQKPSIYQINFTLKTNYFDKKATEFNKDLALLSYGLSLNTQKPFFEGLGFDNIASHYPTPTKDTIGYSLLHHRSEEGKDVVAVVISGNDYKKEWENNFELGSTGDHVGFTARALDIYAALKTYLANYNSPKMLITGYSRGGAISNVLAHHIFTAKEISISKDNMFVYTFEAPKALLTENKVEYKNIFNVVNSADFVPCIAPKEYGFSRYGEEINIASDKLEEYLASLDENIELPAFTADTGDTPKYTTPEEFLQYFIDTILEEEPETPPEEGLIYIPNRSDFATKMQKPIQDALDIYFSLTSETINKIVEDAKKNILVLLSFITVKDAAYNFLKPYLDEAGYEYDEEVLKADLEAIRLFAYGKMAFAFQFLANDGLKNNLVRSIYMHLPESTYVLIKNYTPVTE